MKKLCWLLVALLCLACTSALAAETTCTHPSATPVDIDDDMCHGLKCDTCGEVYDMAMHKGTGTYVDANTCSFSCAACGFTSSSHEGGMGASGEGYHGTFCMHCDSFYGEPEYCYEECTDQDGECDFCDQWTWKETCFEKCTDQDGFCDECGAEVVEVRHAWPEYTPNGDGTHTAVCTECDYTAVQAHELELEPGDEENHIYRCAACDYSKAEAHDLGDEAYQHNADSHYIPCQICGAHLWEGNHANACGEPGECMFCGGAYTSETVYHIFYTDTLEYDNEGHWYPCIGCGEPQAYEAHSYADASAKECQVCGRSRECQHDYWYTYSPRPTCTEEGVKVVKCRYCDKIQSTTTVPAKGHKLTTEDKGEYILESCANCDYEVQLPEGKEIKSLFTVEAAADEQPDGKITVTLTLTEEEAAALENAELVLILEDGTTVNLTYEVKDGQLVFETEALGTFAFIG